MKTHNSWAIPDIESHFIDFMYEGLETDYQDITFRSGLALTESRNTVIDVGGNLGLFSVRYARLFKNVFSFEPVPTNYECLLANTESFDNVVCYPVALGDIEGSVNISLPKKAGNSGAFSAVDFKELDERKLTTHECSLRTLDSFDLEPDLIKVDIQGYEEKFLLGAMETIRRSKPGLILENVTVEAIQPLIDLGYEEFAALGKVKHDRFLIYR